jgi:zinc transporter ZupT
MFPNYHPPDKKKSEPVSSGCCTLESKLCSISVRDFVTIAALSFHSIFEGLAIGLETTNDDVWQLFGGLHSTHISFNSSSFNSYFIQALNLL